MIDDSEYHNRHTERGEPSRRDCGVCLPPVKDRGASKVEGGAERDIDQLRRNYIDACARAAIAHPTGRGFYDAIQARERAAEALVATLDEGAPLEVEP